MEEICLKFQNSHDIVIGGDLNEDLNKLNQDKPAKRLLLLKKFIDTFSLQYSTTEKTYISPTGVECSEIDYFLVKSTQLVHSPKLVLTDMATNTSDHHPIMINIVAPTIPKDHSAKKKQVNKTPTRIKWDKVNIVDYQQAIVELMNDNSMPNIDPPNEVEEECKNLINVLRTAGIQVAPQRKLRKSNPKLRVWNAEISLALRNQREAIRAWAQEGKPVNPNHPVCIERKNAKRRCRSAVRREQARKHHLDKERIMTARTSDTKLFYSLINRQRKKLTHFVEDINVDGINYSGEETVTGFKVHFENLAQTSDCDSFLHQYDDQVSIEIDAIQSLVDQNHVKPVSEQEYEDATKSINTGKAPDIHGLTIEHIINAGPAFQTALLNVINTIFQLGVIPKILKTGILTPVFKNKGNISEVCNYRGITVLPVFEKIVESILRRRISPLIQQKQNSHQRGFTPGVSPLHASLIIEEVTRETRDKHSQCNLIFLDAKSAFDVVNHKHLLRRLYHAGVQDKHWQLIQSLHTDSCSVIKWMATRSTEFQVHQGVKQGGVASTDLYKLYIDPLLHRLEESSLGNFIGCVPCNSSACADDVAICSSDDIETQILINIAEDFSQAERYILQPKKTESLIFNGKRIKKSEERTTFQLYDNDIANVTTATHLGIKRGSTATETGDSQTDHNIEKARRSMYSLLSSGLHGDNGLDPATSIHLTKVYVIPTLLYGLEIVQLNKTQILKLERFQKKILKQILSVPTNTSDAAIYMLSGLLPVEGAIHRKILTFYYSICTQAETSVEKRLARRQIALKQLSSYSWFTQVKKILLMYSLPDAELLLSEPFSKDVWRRKVNFAVNRCWRDRILDAARACRSLRYMNLQYNPGYIHPILQIPLSSARSITRIPTKLRILTGTYILQTNRVAFNQNEVDPTCQLCCCEGETLEHFLLRCPTQQTVRDSCLPEIIQELDNLGISYHRLSTQKKLAVLIDSTVIVYSLEKQVYKRPILDVKPKLDSLHKFEEQCRRFVFLLHSNRFRTLATIPNRKGKRARAHHKSVKLI